jgi:hypothetical protein
VQALRAGDGSPPQPPNAGKRTEGGY